MPQAFMRSSALATLAAALAATALFVALSMPMTLRATGRLFKHESETGVLILHALAFMLLYWGFVYLWDAAADDGEDL